MVVGIRARTTQLTSGSFSNRFGAGSSEVSTGTDWASRSRAGVPVPGVAGGVKAGLRRGGWSWWLSWKWDIWWSD